MLRVPTLRALGQSTCLRCGPLCVLSCCGVCGLLILSKIPRSLSLLRPRLSPSKFCVIPCSNGFRNFLSLCSMSMLVTFCFVCRLIFTVSQPPEFPEQLVRSGLLSRLCLSLLLHRLSGRMATFCLLGRPLSLLQLAFLTPCRSSPFVVSWIRRPPLRVLLAWCLSCLLRRFLCGFCGNLPLAPCVVSGRIRHGSWLSFLGFRLLWPWLVLASPALYDFRASVRVLDRSPNGFVLQTVCRWAARPSPFVSPEFIC